MRYCQSTNVLFFRQCGFFEQTLTDFIKLACTVTPANGHDHQVTTKHESQLSHPLFGRKIQIKELVEMLLRYTQTQFGNR